MLPMLDTDRLEDVVPHDKRICLVLTKGERSRNNLPVKVVVLSIPGPQATFKMDVDCDTVYTLMAEIRASTNGRRGKTYTLHTGQVFDIQIADSAYTLARYGINANQFITVYLLFPDSEV